MAGNLGFDPLNFDFDAFQRDYALDPSFAPKGPMMQKWSKILGSQQTMQDFAYLLPRLTGLFGGGDLNELKLARYNATGVNGIDAKPDAIKQSLNNAERNAARSLYVLEDLVAGRINVDQATALSDYVGQINTKKEARLKAERDNTGRAHAKNMLDAELAKPDDGDNLTEPGERDQRAIDYWTTMANWGKEADLSALDKEIADFENQFKGSLSGVDLSGLKALNYFQAKGPTVYGTNHADLINSSAPAQATAPQGRTLSAEQNKAIYDAFAQHANNPALIHQLANANNVTAQEIATALGQPLDVVNRYFSQAGLTLGQPAANQGAATSPFTDDQVKTAMAQVLGDGANRQSAWQAAQARGVSEEQFNRVYGQVRPNGERSYTDAEVADAMRSVFADGATPDAARRLALAGYGISGEQFDRVLGTVRPTNAGGGAPGGNAGGGASTPTTPVGGSNTGSSGSLLTMDDPQRWTGGNAPAGMGRPSGLNQPSGQTPPAAQPTQNLGMGGWNNYTPNPYLAQMDESIKSEVNDNLNRNILPGIRGGAVAAGQYGGSRQGVVEANALNDASKATANAMAGVRFQDYNQGLNRNLNAYQFDKNYGLANDTLNFNIDQANYNRGVTNLGLGFGVMDKMLDYQQRGYDIGTTQQNAPLNYWNQFMNQANATGGRGATNTTNMQGNPWMGAIGGAALGSSIYKNFGFGG